MNRPSICNSCGNLMGVADVCPYCGARRNSPIGFLKGFARSLESADSWGKITNFVLIASAIMYVLQAVITGFSGDRSLLGALMKGAPGHVFWLMGASTTEIYQGSVYRLVTASFLHGNLLHIILNMYALKQIGPLIERIVGPFLYLPLYLFCGALGFAASSLSFAFGGNIGISVGASAGLFGFIAFGCIVAFIRGEGKDDPLFKALFVWIIFGLAFGLFVDNVDNWAHIGGMVGGVITGLVWTKLRSIVGFSFPAKVMGLASVLLVLGCFLYAFGTNWQLWTEILSSNR